MNYHESASPFWTPKMHSGWAFRPNLLDCILEERVSPAIANFGLIVLTTSGLSMVTPFPGASNSASGSLGSSGPSSGSAASVSGVPVPTSFYVTGQGGISSTKPGNLTGLASLAAGGSVAAAASGLSIQVGSGANDSSAPTSTGGAPTSTVGFATYADPTQRPTMTVIGGALSSSGGSSLPAPSAAYSTPSTTMLPGQTMSPPTGVPTMTPGMMITNPFNPNPQMGAPTLGPFNRLGGLGAPQPGALSVPSLTRGN
jgi:hypothetical protein